MEEARQLVEMFGWSQYFCMQEIYPGDKTAHFIQSVAIFFYIFSLLEHLSLKFI